MNRKVSSRVKAAVVCAAMLTTAVATPTFATSIVKPTYMTAEAASLKTMKADDVYTTTIDKLVSSGAKTLSFTFTPNYTGNFAYGLGIGIADAPYWQEYDSKKGFTDSKDSSGKEIPINSSQVAVTKGVPATVTFDVSKLKLKYVPDAYGASEIQFRAYYTGEGASDSIDLTSVKANDSSTPVTPTNPSESPTTPTTPTTPSKPASSNQETEVNQVIDDNTDSDPKTNVFTGYITDYATSGIKTITFNLESEKQLNNFTFGFGINTDKEPYWYEYSADGSWVDTTNGGKAVSSKRIPTSKEFSVTIDVSKLSLKYVDDEYGRAKFEFRNYYSAGEKVTVKSVVINTTDNKDQGEPKPSTDGAGYPETLNKSVVSYDEANHKATLKNTITRKISGEQLKKINDDKDLILTPGYDEDTYVDPDTGMSSYKTGDPINSVKLSFGQFGVSSNRTSGKVTIDSVSATISSPDNVSRFMFGGGISVQSGSIADTEYPKQIAGIPGKQNAGYWYNDCGADELEVFNSALEVYKEKMGSEAVDVVTPGQGCDVTDASALGSYFTVTWDVPEEVKPYVDLAGNVSFQYWYGEKAVEDDSEDATLGAVNLEEMYITYTEETTIPYTGKTETKVNQKVANDGKYEVKYSDLGIKSYQDVYAVILNVSTKADNQMVFDYSTSTTTKDQYYITSTDYSNYCIPKADGTSDLLWIMPKSIVSYEEGVKDENYVDSNGSLTFYNFYTADHSATPTKSDITVNNVTVLYRDGLEMSDEEIELEVGESKTVTASLKDVSYASKNEKVATVAADGTITGVAKGVTNVEVTAPDGQVATIKVTVKEAATEPTTTATTEAPTTTTTTTTTKATTEEKTSESLKVTKWGDVNVDGETKIADVILLNKYLVGSGTVTAQGLVNADCWNDGKITADDSLTILKLLVLTYTEDDMPRIPD